MSLKGRFLYITDANLTSNRAGAIHVKELSTAMRTNLKDFYLCSKTDSAKTGDRLFSNHQRISVPNIKGALVYQLLSLNRNIRQIRPNYIYSRFLLISWLRPKCPYFLELHSADWKKGWLFMGAIKRAVRDRNCLGFVVITASLKKDLLEEFKINPSRITVIPDAARQPPEGYKRIYRETKKLNVAYIGSFHKGKGLELVLSLAQKRAAYNFVIMGGNHSQIEQLKTRGVSANVKFMGFVEHDLLWTKLQEVDICLLPNQPKVHTGKKSDIGKYTSPLKMFEYMAFGKPIVASDLGVLREVLDEDLGILVPHDDIEAWALAIDSLSEKNKRASLGENAFKRFSENFTWDHRWQRILDFIVLKSK